MKITAPFTQAAIVACAALSLGACGHVEVAHVPPGQSLGVALAKKADIVHFPAVRRSVAVAATSTFVTHVPAVEPDLPKMDNMSRAEDAYSQGEFCMTAGKDAEAIQAFEEAVKIEPAFTEAWQRLAILYEKKGDNKKAMDAFRRSKKIARQ